MQVECCTHTNDKKYTLYHMQHSGGIKHSTIQHPDALGGHVWDGSETIYWKLDGSYPHIPEKQMIQLIKYAFLEQSFQTPLVIRRRNRPTSDAQIKINWRYKKDDPHLTSDSILAYAFGPRGGIGGDITMNADVLWLLRNTPLTAKEAKEEGYIDNFSDPSNIIKYYDPLHTMKHEGGHALGMKHLEDQSLRHIEPMYPFYNGTRKFSQAGIDYLHRLYGEASVPHRIKEVLLHRITSFF